jgi:hypothetical protein
VVNLQSMLLRIPHICESLNVLYVTEVKTPTQDGTSAVVCAPRGRISTDWTKSEDKTYVILSQNGNPPLTVVRLIEKVTEELAKLEHAHVSPRSEKRTEIAATVLALATLLRPPGIDTVDVLEAIFQNISSSQVAQWAVLISPATNRDLYHFGEFTSGEIDLQTLRYRSEQAGSNFGLYERDLLGRRAVWREARDIRTIDWNSINLPHGERQKGGYTFYRITDEYYGELAGAERGQFMLELDRQQAIFAAIGLGTIPSASLRQTIELTRWVTIFSRQERRHGWVVPDQTPFMVRSTEPKAHSDGMASIKNGLQLQDWGQRPLDQYLQMFSEYIATALDQWRDDRPELAFLHLVFALDQLLGGDSGEGLTKIVAERASILAYRALSKHTAEITAFVRDCHDARSGYAHLVEKGKLPNSGRAADFADRFNLLLKISRAVIGAGCFARRQEWCQVKDPRGAWLKRIDLVVSANQAGVVDKSHMVLLGLEEFQLNAADLVGVSLKSGV